MSNPATKRTPPLAILGLTTLTGCYDFTGDLGNLGFSSDLQVGGAEHWDPTYGVALGTTPTFAVTECFDCDTEGTFLPITRGVARITEVDTTWARVKATRAGTATLAWQGPVHDRFQVRFRSAVHADLIDQLLVISGLPETLAAGETHAVLPGGAHPLAPRLTDRWGRELGYRPADLSISGTGAASAWMEDGQVFVSVHGEVGDTGVVRIRLGERELGAIPVEVGDLEDVVDVVTGTRVFGEGEEALQCAWAAPILADGRSLRGTPMSWESTAARADTGRADVACVKGEAAPRFVVEVAGFTTPIDPPADG